MVKMYMHVGPNQHNAKDIKTMEDVQEWFSNPVKMYHGKIVFDEIKISDNELLIDLTNIFCNQFPKRRYRWD